MNTKDLSRNVSALGPTGKLLPSTSVFDFFSLAPRNQVGLEPFFNQDLRDKWDLQNPGGGFCWVFPASGHVNLAHLLSYSYTRRTLQPGVRIIARQSSQPTCIPFLRSLAPARHAPRPRETFTLFARHAPAVRTPSLAQ